MKSSRRKGGKKTKKAPFVHLLLKNGQDVNSIETIHRQSNMGKRKPEMMAGHSKNNQIWSVYDSILQVSGLVFT